MNLESNSSNPVVILKSESNTFTVPIVGGEALFDGLYIFEADVSCKLVFTTNLSLAGGSSCFSSTFSALAGNASSIDIIDYVPITTTAGIPFAIQPRVCLVDTGKNILRNESRLQVRVSIGRNPTGGSLSPANRLVATFQQGVAQFKHLLIGVAGQGYVLCFDLVEADGITVPNWAKISTCGKPNICMWHTHSATKDLF